MVNISSYNYFTIKIQATPVPYPEIGDANL